MGKFHLISSSVLASGAVPTPTDIQFTEVGPTFFTITWLSPSVRLTGYRVVVSPQNNLAPPKELNVAPDSSRVNVQGLMVCYILPIAYSHQQLFSITVFLYAICFPISVEMYFKKRKTASYMDCTISEVTMNRHVTGYLLCHTNTFSIILFEHPPLSNRLPPLTLCTCTL